MDRVILIGYFIETAELCEKCSCSIVGVVDNDDKGSYPYLGNDEDFANNCTNYLDIPLVITPDNPSVREKLYDRYKKLGFKFKTLIAPEAVISKSAHISEGCVIQSLCNISSDVSLGKCVRVNTGANIMHDTVVGDFSTVAPNAVLLGRCNIGCECYIGANATILPGVKIYGGVLVGAGAVVCKDINSSMTVVGVPARKLV